MTREKKELLKKLEAINIAENMDYEMDGSGECGRLISECYEEQKRSIYERLNGLMHGRLNDYAGACIV